MSIYLRTFLFSTTPYLTYSPPSPTLESRTSPTEHNPASPPKLQDDLEYKISRSISSFQYLQAHDSAPRLLRKERDYFFLPFPNPPLKNEDFKRTFQISLKGVRREP